MSTGHGQESASGRVISVGRKGVAALLFALARPADAKASTLDGDALRLTLSVGSREIAIGDIDAVEQRAQWRWAVVRVRTASGDSAVSGLSPGDASAFAAAVGDARTRWWRAALLAHGDTLVAAAAPLPSLSRPQHYVRRRAFEAMRDRATYAVVRFPGRWPEGMPTSPQLAALEAIRGFLANPDAARSMANDAFVSDELERSRTFLDDVESRPLTDEQRRAVVVDDDRNLAVAAAGSGKTSVMVAKAGWLLERGACLAEEVLLLAFGRNARDELVERVEERLGTAARGMDVRTFHELGLSIIGQAEGRRPALAKSAGDRAALHGLLDGVAAELQRDRRYGPKLARWLVYGFAPYRSPHEFSTWGEYLDYVRSHEIRSLKGDLVKSFEECRIANFLYTNGIPYEYERVYEHDTATVTKGPYRPDFYLPGRDIYIEHFALTKSGDTPPFIDRESYTAERQWKLDLHAEHGSTLVQTFSHEQRDGKLMANLARRLRENGVAFNPIAPDEVFAALNEQGRVAPFTRLVATFLQHFKGSRLSAESVLARAADSADPGRAKAFVEVFAPILDRYERHLAELGEIDFDDMINRATDHVVAGRYESPYRYILVDEFQDISASRAALLKALLDRSAGAQLFAVGDDWQAIYRFAGADIAIMRRFETRFGNGTRSTLETTFRCSDGVSAVATRFVLGNPAQIPKDVRTRRTVDGPGVWLGLAGEEGASVLGEALRRIGTDAASRPHRPEVLVLGRYSHLEPDMSALRYAHPALNLSFSTVHGAKGLEADYVVVRGLNAGRYGFPSEISDDPLLDLVLAEREGHANAEERRLLYVAMTRARYRTFLLVEGQTPSTFAKELMQQDDVGIFGRPAAADVAC
ncbi:MAG: UvrD-helicase domain-containing protein, partial [Gammaproteobacteria bacterium]|nr:UvrD-helicase domain-containing protein [Gammaproteobacteria bacterium]